MRKKELNSLPKPKYKDGHFKHRTVEDECKHFGGACPVNREQKDPEEDTCDWCIKNRDPVFSERR